MSIPRKVFLLDDNLIDRETCRRYLRKAGNVRYEFFEYNSIEGALPRVEAADPDCILLDYNLHDGTGLEFLHALIASFGCDRFAVVMLTGSGNEQLAVEAMKIGARDYLSKERLNPEMLQRTIDNAIYKAETGRVLTRQQEEMERLFKEARAANARKDEFLAALSHELRTPLTPVLAQVSQADFSTFTKTDFINAFAMIRRNIEVEARLIDDMLDLARIASGKLEIRTRPVDLHEILRHAAEACEAERKNKWIHLNWELAAGLAQLEADPARLQQVFWNLLKNAIKFTPENGMITVSTGLGDGAVIVRVADTGIGLNPKIAEKIFDAFEQGGEQVTRRFGGLGLGLAISKALVLAHEGTIEAANREETTGAIFTVTLPSAESGKPLPAVQLSSAPLPTQTTTRRSVLLVEDHADSGLLFKRMLEMGGYLVHFANCVRRAREIAQENAIDFVVSDLGLPDGSGYDLIADIQSIKPIPAIALSGFGMEHDVQRSREAGFLLHLTKPVDLPSLFGALQRLEQHVSGLSQARPE